MFAVLVKNKQLYKTMYMIFYILLVLGSWFYVFIIIIFL